MTRLGFNLRALFVAQLILFGVTSVHANWYSDGTQQNSDIIMKEVRYPFWSKGWYNAFWNGRFLPKGGRYYGGIASYGPGKDAPAEKQQAYFPELVWTFWGSKDYNRDNVKNIYIPTSDIEYKGTGNEGAQGGATGRPKFMRSGVWYNMLMRTWPSVDSEDVSYVGWWIKDMEKNEWHTVGIFRVPCHVTGFAGNAEFAEYMGSPGANRVFERRNGYCRSEGQWHHMNSISVRGASYSVLSTNENIIRFDSHVRTKQDLKPISISIPEQAGPTLDQPAITSETAKTYKDQTLVEWDIPIDAAPQRAYRLTAYSKFNGKGRVVTTRSKAHPHIRQDSITAQGARSVTLTIIDIFDQEISRTIPIENMPSQEALTVHPELRHGVEYRYYKPPKGEKWTELPDFWVLKPLKSGILAFVDDTIREGQGGPYAIQFDGYLKIPEDGIYLFEYTMSGDSRLFIGDSTVIESGGSITRSPQRGAIALEKGVHALHFEGLKKGARGRSNTITVRWAGRDHQFRDLATEALYCSAEQALPDVTISATRTTPHIMRFTPIITGGNAEIRKIDFYSGVNLIRALHPTKSDDSLYIDVLLSLPEPSSQTNDLENAFLLPHGKNEVHARLWTKDGRSVYSNTLHLEFTNNVCSSPWSITPEIPTPSIPFGVKTTDDTIAVVGSQNLFVHQTIKGDFTMTAHIAQAPGRNKEYGFGYTASDRFGLRVSGKAGRPFALYRLAKGGGRVTADHANLDGWGVSYWHIAPPVFNWLRISKEGNRACSFISVDGKTWLKATERIGGIPSPTQVGLTFLAAEAASALYHAAIDQISIETNAFDLPRLFPTDEELDTTRRITAVIQSQSDPNILMARTTHAGVIKSIDHGETWQSINATIPGTERVVRSIAIHPTNSDIMLRASGGVAADGVPTRTLYRSADGGLTWEAVATNIDFAVTGPALLFGEIISFNAADPDVVAVGGESSGVLISHDAGKTWSEASLKNQYISTLMFHPYVAKGASRLLVGTMPDAEWAAFGVSAPPVAGDKAATLRKDGRIIGGDASGARWKTAHQHAKLGVLRFAPVRHYNQIVCATTRGLFYTSYHKRDLFLRPAIPRQTPYIALAEQLLNAEQRSIRNRGHYSEHLSAPFTANASPDVYRSILKAYTWTAANHRNLRHDTVKEELWGKLEPGPITNVNEGITSLLRHKDRDHTIYACNTKGIFISTDFARTWTSLLPLEQLGN